MQKVVNTLTTNYELVIQFDSLFFGTTPFGYRVAKKENMFLFGEYVKERAERLGVTIGDVPIEDGVRLSGETFSLNIVCIDRFKSAKEALNAATLWVATIDQRIRAAACSYQDLIEELAELPPYLPK